MTKARAEFVAGTTSSIWVAVMLESAAGLLVPLKIVGWHGVRRLRAGRRDGERDADVVECGCPVRHGGAEDVLPVGGGGDAIVLDG